MADCSERAADGHVMSGELRCASCDARYPIRRGIPRLAAGILTPDTQATTTRFGYQWQRAGASLRPGLFTSAETFLDFIAPVAQQDFRDQVVLDAGCGAGRFTRLASEFGSRAVVGVDLSDSVEVSFEATRSLPNVLIVQASLERLPLTPSFDYAFSVGVLHHTAEPEVSFREVASRLRPGGRMSAWVYALEGNEWVVRFVDPVRKNLTSKLPLPLLRTLSYGLAVPLYLVTKAVYGPVGRNPKLNRLRERLFYFDYLFFLSRFTFADIALIIFDHLHPSLAEYIPRAELESWFVRCDMPNPLITSRAGNSWRGFGTRGVVQPEG